MCRRAIYSRPCHSPFPVLLTGLCDSCWEDWIGRHYLHNSFVVDFCSFVSCSLAKVKLLSWFLKNASVPGKSQSVHSSMSPYS